MTIEMDTCKDCGAAADDYELATHRGRCASCFEGYGRSFTEDATLAFVNHVLTLAASDPEAAAELKTRYWEEHTLPGDDEQDFTIACGLCLRGSDLGVYVNGDPIAHVNPICPDHGDPVSLREPDLFGLESVPFALQSTSNGGSSR